MVYLGSIVARSHQVYLFEKTITPSDRKPGNLNFLTAEPRDMRISFADTRLSLDNLVVCADTGGY